MWRRDLRTAFTSIGEATTLKAAQLAVKGVPWEEWAEDDIPMEADAFDLASSHFPQYSDSLKDQIDARATEELSEEFLHHIAAVIFAAKEEHSAKEPHGDDKLEKEMEEELEEEEPDKGIDVDELGALICAGKKSLKKIRAVVEAHMAGKQIRLAAIFGAVGRHVDADEEATTNHVMGIVAALRKQKSKKKNGKRARDDEEGDEEEDQADG
jgi:hypothetical protein